MLHKGNNFFNFHSKIKDLQKLTNLRFYELTKLRFKVVYKLICSGCNSTYVDQAVQSLATSVCVIRRMAQ